MVNEKNEKGYIVRVSEHALFQLCQAGLEAYSVPGHTPGQKKRRRQLETYALLWGHEAQMTNGQTLYQVEAATVDTTAARGPAAIIPNPKAIELKVDLMSSFWPHLEFLGNCHTHPWQTRAEAVASRGHWFSEQDVYWIKSSKDFQANNYRVGLVLMIALLQRKRPLSTKWLDGWSTVEFTLGTYRLRLKAYIAYDEGGHFTLSGDEDPDVIVECPSLLGLRYEYTTFGRGNRRGHSASSK